MRRLIVRYIAGGLICSGALACVKEERLPWQPAAQPTTTVVSTHPQPGVTNAQPSSSQPASTTPVVNNVTELPEPSINVPPTAGVTEQQADERTRAMQALSTASTQADRLKRMESTAAGAYREDLDAAAANLQSKRRRVLQDLQELELATPGRDATARMQLDRDVTALEQALRATYAVAPAPSEGLPSPSPLPPALP